MSLLPDKNLYVVTSALRPLTGTWSFSERFNQTIQTLKRIREKDSNSIIILSDASVNTVPEMEKQILCNLCDYYYDLSDNPDVKYLSSNRMQSPAETILLLITLSIIKQQPFLSQCKRIFKISARSVLNDEFDPEEHNIFGKYVFKKRIATWMTPQQVNASHLLITRMYSFCTSLLDDYIQVLQNNLPLLNVVDFEHAHFVNIPKNRLVEFEKIHIWGWLSGGSIEQY